MNDTLTVHLDDGEHAPEPVGFVHTACRDQVPNDLDCYEVVLDSTTTEVPAHAFCFACGEPIDRTCTANVELWGPHEGCREFMDEPEAVVLCGGPAVQRVQWTDADEVDFACAEHRVPEDDPDATVADLP